MVDITLKDLFIAENSYIIEIPINNKYYLFVEGLNEYGITNIVKEKFDINNIKTLCIELFNNDGEYEESIDSYGIDLTEKVEIIKEKTLNLIGGDSVD